MDLIIGGAYQGKLAYAKEELGVREDDIFICTREAEPDFTKRCLVHYENYVLYCLRAGKKADLRLREDAVVVADDIFCGVVSVDTEVRAWREETGRALTALARRAEHVTRVFCGLPLKLKG